VAVSQGFVVTYPFPKVAPLGDSRFVVAWSGVPASYRIFDLSGEATTPELDLDADCIRLVFAESLGAHGIVLGCSDLENLRLGRLTKQGLSPFVTAAPSTPALGGAAATLTPARIAIAWVASGGVEARGFKVVPLFEDGFESGTTAAWSLSVP
jgi:hypothetical protein